MSLTAELRSHPPTFHGDGEYWGLDWSALEWLEENVESGMATLETGSGSSTIVFAARGAVHEAVTPEAGEETRIRGECEKRGIATDQVAFRVGSSHEVLPAWEPRPLDLVLIDGAHGFPYPILDWWHVQEHLKIGGRVLLDDAYMPPVGVLLDWLESSPAWRVEEPVGFRTALVTKVAEGLPDFDWGGERVGRGMSFRYLPAPLRVRSAVRQRAFSTRPGLAAVRFARRRLRFLWR
jgi:Methyltransferase domain